MEDVSLFIHGKMLEKAGGRAAWACVHLPGDWKDFPCRVADAAGSRAPTYRRPGQSRVQAARGGGRRTTVGVVGMGAEGNTDRGPVPGDDKSE